MTPSCRSTVGPRDRTLRICRVARTFSLCDSGAQDMRVLIDVKRVIGVVDRELGYLDDVYFALRAFCDPSVIELRSLPTQRRLQNCLRNIVDRTIEPARTPLVARIIGQEPGRWIEAVLKIRRSGTFRSPIFRWLFGAYEAAQSGFEN